MFSALSYICVFLFRFQVGFLTFDLKDAVMTVGALYFGPISGVIMAAIVSFLEYITVSGTGLYGLLMNFLASAAFTLGASLLYRWRRRLEYAVAGLGLSIVGMTSVMIVANIVITPLYLGTPRGEVITMIPTLLLPFNVVKAMLNAALVLLLYKPITIALSRARLIPRPTGSIQLGKKSILVMVISGILLLASILLFVFLLNGSLVFGR